MLIDQFIASFETAAHAADTFDIDAFDDPTHGQQQLTFFHGYYGQYQYLPRTITCADNDQVVMVCLLFGTAHAALGAPEDIEYLVGRLRAVWPDVRTSNSAPIPDSAYRPCTRSAERLEGVVHVRPADESCFASAGK